jgi:2-polyprenyl-3-methyl-5-hydroxy-6-metoxy-1,4-benzoquinol methylase
MGRRRRLALDPNKPHLGGNPKGIDIETHSIKVWDWLLSKFQIKSVLDVGCGEGHALEYFKNKGLSVFGIEGLAENIIEVNRRGIDNTIFDLTEGIYKHYEEVDLIWCCELVEHVEEKYVNNIIHTFLNGKIVAMTHAIPRQKGYHHVNCKDDKYWIDILCNNNFRYLEKLTQEARLLEIEEHTYFSRSGLIFMKE